MILEICGITLFAAFSGADEKNAPFTCNLICKTTLKSTKQIRGNTLISTNSKNAVITIKVCHKYDVFSKYVFENIGTYSNICIRLSDYLDIKYNDRIFDLTENLNIRIIE